MNRRSSMPTRKSVKRPNIVVMGGGTGSHNVLSGLRRFDCDITAIVAMTDSGGSSGRLRDEFGQLPPGDVRQCLVALAPDDRSGLLIRNLFNYRFDKGSGLNGHSFGNLFLTALTELTGSAEAAIAEAARLLNVRGTVLPVTLTKSTLCAHLMDGSVIKGEAQIDRRREKLEVPIDYVYLEPKALVHPPAADAILKADVIVIGPGDLYTSIIPNLLVQGIPEALKTSSAIKIYVCNLMTKRGETPSFKASNFLHELLNYLEAGTTIDYLVLNSAPVPERLLQRYAREGAHPVEVDVEACRSLGAKAVTAPLLSAATYLRHDPALTASLVLRIASGAEAGRRARRR